MKHEMVTVLDLGSTKAAILVMSLVPGGQPQLEAVGIAPCKGVRRGVVVDFDETVRAIEAAAQKAEQQLGRELGDLVVGVAGTHIECKNVQGFMPIYPRSRTITREDVMQVVNHSRHFVLPDDREQIMAIPREFKVDSEKGITRPVGMTGGSLEVTTFLVNGQTNQLETIEKAVEQAGRKVRQMVLAPLASGLAVLSEAELQLGTAIVDIGGGTSDLGIFVNGMIAYAASLPVGGSLVTSDIAKLLKADPEEAEDLKVNQGFALATMATDNDVIEVMQLGQTHKRPMQRRVLCEIIQSRMRELAVMVKQKIEESGFDGQLTGGIVLTGGGSLLKGADKLFEKELGAHKVRVAEASLGGQAELEGHSMATAIGLAKFMLLSMEDELVPAGGSTDWKERVRTFWSLLGKA
ncbi:MAG: cell division protein FtsA [Armatimonadetes bacterium]|nr:cell division protein FtsA [Armatimonadota bacterium]